ncbi:MAG: carboxypeptidase regulatory-like domain-containing protein [Candidatus Solibacter usitatus]|nr:carboxypeptidase regulatory-like domain-containing protein [Candidatus Solibacter usitatus]
MQFQLRPRHLLTVPLCVLSILLLSPSALGGSLTVQVVDCDSDGLTGASVTVAPADAFATPPPAPPGGTVTTDADGIAAFGRLGGNYNVTVSCGGRTLTKTIYINPLFFHDQTLVVRCCEGEVTELDWWDYAGGQPWTENSIGASVVKTSWKRPFGNLTIAVVDCTNKPLSGPWTFIVRTSNKRTFGRRQAVGGVVRHRMLAAGAYQVYVSCPPLLGPFAVNVASQANVTITIKCLGTSCTGTPGLQDIIETFPDGSRFRTTPDKGRVQEAAAGADASPRALATAWRRDLDQQSGLETVTVPTSHGNVALNVPTGWRDSSSLWITVVSEDTRPAQPTTDAAPAGATIEGAVVDIGGRRVEAHKSLTPIFLSASALTAAKLITILEGDGILKPVATVAVDGLAKGVAPATECTVVQSGQPVSLPSQTPIIDREYSIAPVTTPGAPGTPKPADLVAGTDNRSVIWIPPDIHGPSTITESVKGKPVRTQQVHALSVTAKLDKPLKDGVIHKGQTVGATANLKGTAGLDQVLKKKDVLLTFKSSGGVTVKPSECKLDPRKDSYPMKITGLAAGTFKVDVRVVERSK